MTGLVEVCEVKVNNLRKELLAKAREEETGLEELWDLERKVCIAEGVLKDAYVATELKELGALEYKYEVSSLIQAALDGEDKRLRLAITEAVEKKYLGLTSPELVACYVLKGSEYPMFMKNQMEAFRLKAVGHVVDFENFKESVV